jgi:hypothetical protein
MGWYFQHKPRGEKTSDILRKTFTWESEQTSQRVLDISTGLHVAYAAIERVEKATGTREVNAVVVLLAYRRDYFNFGYKVQDEFMGPCDCDCPARILDLLTPTDHEIALRWRARCRERLEQKAKLRHGMKVKLPEPVTFTSGIREQEFIVEKRGRAFCFRTGYGTLCRLSRESQRQLMEVPA